MANNEQLPTQLKINNLLFPTALKSFDSVDPMLTTDTKMEEALASGNENITPDELPQSLTEIYNISNKNRWKNKDKKRNREINESSTNNSVNSSSNSSNNNNNNNQNNQNNNTNNYNSSNTNENTNTTDSNEIDQSIDTQPLTSSFMNGIEWLDAPNPVNEKTPEGTVRKQPYYLSFYYFYYYSKFYTLSNFNNNNN